jgi:hypothetical protein
MRIMNRLSAVLVTGCLLGSFPSRAGGRADGQQAATGASGTVDIQKLGPQVGTAVPDFNLPDQRNQRRTLRSLLGPKGAVLVFFRSADW